jgi:hypothetical protein
MHRSSPAPSPFRRFALAGVVGLLILAGLPAAVTAAPAPIDLQMEAGYRGTARPGQWMPVTITVRNPGGDFRGTLSILSGTLPSPQPYGGGAMAPQPMPVKGIYGGPVAPAVYRVPVVLPAGSTKRFTTYVLAAAAETHVDLLNSQDQPVAGTDARVRLGYNEGLAAVVSDSDQALDLLGSVRLPGANGQVQVVHFKPAELPNSGILLRAFDTVALDDAATEAFTPSQKNALVDYVDMGGGLFIAGGASWRKTVAGLPAELLPVVISGTRSPPDLPRTRNALGASRLTTPVDVAVAERRIGVTVLSEDGLPILVEAPFGQGYVIFSAVEFTLEPMASWNGTRSLLRQALVRLLVTQPSGVGKGGLPIRTTRPGVSDRGAAMSQALMNIPALDLPSLKLVGLLLLAYVLLAGPLNYLLLWRLGRRDLAWITLPLIALVFAVGAYGVGLRSKGKDILANQVRIIHLSDHSSRAYIETFTGIFVPHRGSYSARPGGQPFVSGLGGFYGGQPGSVGAGVVLVTGGGGSVPDVRLVDVNAWSMRGFSSEELVINPGTLTQDLHLANGRITGTVTNRLGFALTDGFVVAGDSYQTFGRIGKGETVPVNLAVGSIQSAQLGQPIAYRIYQMPTYKGDPNSAAQRETLRRIQIVTALFPYNSMNSSAEPMLVGWAQSSHLPLKVNGSDADVRDLDAVVMPLRVAPATNTGSLAEGEITARLVDLTGEQVNLSGSGLYFATRGTATYELALPGAAWHNVQLRLSRNLGPFTVRIGGTLGQPQVNLVDLAVYNYRTGAWDAMALRTEGETDVALVSAPAAHISPEGLVQVRLQTKAANGVGGNVGPLTILADPGAQ